MKRILIIFSILFFVSFAAAETNRVVYLVNSEFGMEQTIIDNLEDLGFAVDTVFDEDIGDIVFSDYDFMVVNNEIFSNNEDIPVNEFPALILNRYYMDDWEWVRRLSQRASSRPLSGYVTDPDHFITQGLFGTVQLYLLGDLTLTGYYMDKLVKAPAVESVLAISDSPASNQNSALIGTAEEGTKLRNGRYSNTKSVFFGMIEVDQWTDAAEYLFRRSALWLVTDTIPPAIIDVEVSDITNQSATVTWDTDEPGTTRIDYGTTTVFTDSIADSSFSLDHSVDLTGLEEDTIYYFNISSCNEDEVCGKTGTFSFTTLDFTAPNLVSTNINNKTNSTLDISFTFSEQCFSRMYYGVSALSLISPLSALDDEADFMLDALEEGTQYDYLVEMCDPSGNCKNSSLASFATEDYTPPKAPENLILQVINPNNIIKLDWDAPSGESVDHYDIYIYGASDFESYSYISPSAQTSDTDYIDSDAYADRERYYIVRSVDSAGNQENNTNIVAKYDWSLVEGYNLVSLNLDPFDDDIDAVMHQDSGYHPISQIRTFDGGFQTFDYNPSTHTWDPGGMEPLAGYFLNSKHTLDFTVVGYPIISKDIELRKGQNLIGLALYNATDVSSFNQDDYNITEIASRNRNGTYYLATYYPSVSSWYQPNDFDIQPAEGYWLTANKNFTLKIE